MKEVCRYLSFRYSIDENAQSIEHAHDANCPDTLAVREAAIQLGVSEDEVRRYIVDIDDKQSYRDWLEIRAEEAANKANDPLVDCPRCHGFGYRSPSGKLCLCIVENSHGWTPGKLPQSEIDRLHLTSSDLDQEEPHANAHD